ncbi:hypothetical protein UPYG_G00084600 [Umbra pygmaea]|uniref:Shelterin complex subunit TPP1/Est3 domain-containing protein n=1 Tax=Umbra pygmaea TaxID=75934 RepID=A0ABD0XEF4_UMBPY
MFRARTTLEPWIEQLILSYTAEPKEEKKTFRIKAHVVGVSQMSESQTWQTEGLRMLLFLSDGVVHIPAILTQDAWETLQEQEDRECFSSLTNCTVYVYSSTLRFNMASEQTKSQFYLTIGELITSSAGAAKDNTPCCTSLKSVREKICTTWRSLLEQRSLHSQGTQSEFNLSDLLGEWQHDWQQSLLEDVMKLLMTPTTHSSQPSTSTAPMHIYTGTKWDVERVRYKGGDTFNVPVSHLHIPDELSQKQHPPSDDSETQSGLVPSSEDRLQHQTQTETHGPISLAASKQTDSQVPLERRPLAYEPTLHQESLGGDLCLGGAGRPVSSAWDMFAPAVQLLRTSSASDDSLTSEPVSLQESQSLLEPTPPPALPVQVPLATSTQVTSQVSGVTQWSDEHSLPPYQKPCLSPSLRPSTGSSSSTGSVSAKQQRPGMELHQSRSATTHDLPATELQGHIEVKEDLLETCSPSWLHTTTRTGEGTGLRQTAVAAVSTQRPSNVHSDGTSFSYSYKLCGHVSKDLSHFKIPGGMLHWAVQYLIHPGKMDFVKDRQRTPAFPHPK